MRPPGQIRAALRAAWVQCGNGTIRSMLPRAGVNPAAPAEVRLVRRTVERMVQAGELARCGAERDAGGRAWRAVYEAADTTPPSTTGLGGAADAVDAVMRSWVRGR